MKFLKAAALAAAMSRWHLPPLLQRRHLLGGHLVTPRPRPNGTLRLLEKSTLRARHPSLAAGGTLTGKLNFAASTAGTAGVNCGVGTAPASPINGDIWCTSAGMFVQIAGSTVPLGTSGGTLAVTGGGTGQASFTANLPILGNGTGALAQGTRSGNTTTFGTVTGATTSGDCVAFDASGNLHDAGVGACGGTGGAGTVASASSGQLAIYTAATTVSGLAGCNNGYIGTNGAGTVSCITTVNATLSATITALGTIATGTWQGTLISPTFGGTGVNNGSFTSTLGGNFVTSGAAVTLTAIGATNVTLPTSGTLMNQNGTSGGLPYYNTPTTVQSTGTLTANLPVFGGGASSAPFSGTRTGNTTDVATYGERLDEHHDRGLRVVRRQRQHPERFWRYLRGCVWGAVWLTTDRDGNLGIGHGHQQLRALCRHPRQDALRPPILTTKSLLQIIVSASSPAKRGMPDSGLQLGRDLPADRIYLSGGFVHR